ncbi:MAG: hypothetical protein ACRD1O_04480 [Terriglobia bacterium]
MHIRLRRTIAANASSSKKASSKGSHMSRPVLVGLRQLSRGNIRAVVVEGAVVVIVSAVVKSVLPLKARELGETEHVPF